MLLLFSCAGLAPADTSVTLAIEHLAGSKPLQMGMPMPVGRDTTISVTRLEYLISDLSFQSASGATELLPTSTVLHVDVSQQAAAVASFDLVSTHPDVVQISGRIGLSEILEKSNVAWWPPSHALHPLSSNLYWGWQGGWVNLAVEGRSTLRTGAGGKRMVPFLYHLSGKSCAIPFTARVGDDGRALLKFDVAGLWGADGHPLDTGGATHSSGDDPLAVLLAKRLAAYFARTQ